MSMDYERRPSDSPYVEWVTRGQTLSDGSATRPAEFNWHLVLIKRRGKRRALVVGPWTAAGVSSWGADAEILWVRFKLGVFMPHLPPRDVLDQEIDLPAASDDAFWLNGAAWQFPDFENAETFVDRLVRDELLARDALVDAALQEPLPGVPARTLRYRFARATGLTQSYIHQARRAHRAAELLEQGHSILDTVAEAGYYDQPHLTRSLQRFLGHTPGQITASNTDSTT